ncbi:CDGSH iron-sulfur domain-containing protein [bacterium]|nr:CDGSH iron-sulfur domain-containing protein [bacterium]
MPKPVIVKKGPAELILEPGEYWWCACGKSKTQPFCDGTHKEERLFKPKMFVIEEKTKIELCQCKHSAEAPFCDGTHASVSRG